MSAIDLSRQTLDQMFEQLSLGRVIPHVEDTLMIFRQDPTYLVLLLDLVIAPTSPAAQLNAAIEFKNTVLLHWAEQKQAGHDPTHAEVVKNILQGVMGTQDTISDFLQEALITIARSEYPMTWQTLPKEIMEYLSDTNHARNYIAWRSIEKITKRYKNEERSDPLYYEINITLDAVHDKLLYCAQGYLNQLGATDNPMIQQYLKIYRCILKTFYNLCSQDLPAIVDDNLRNWSTILKDTLSKKIDLSNINAALKLDQLWFECKGEAIRSALMFATKYREDFMDAIKPFANEIWNTCLESGQDEKYTSVLVNSMKYFKSFCEHPEFLDFFSENINMMFMKVLIPNLMPNEAVQACFEEEPNSFIENLLANKEFGERAETCIAFIRSLGRFHNEKVQETLRVILSEYLASGMNNFSSEIVCVNLVCIAPVTGFKQDAGVIEINMSDELISSTYQSLVKSRLGPVFQTISKEGVNISQLPLDQFHPVLICYDLKFVSMFRNFIPHTELLDICLYASKLLQAPQQSLQKVALTVMGQILSMKQCQIQNNMNANVDSSSFYAKYYLNPRKVKVTFPQGNNSQVFHSQNVFPQIESMLQNLYIFVSTQDKLEPLALSCLEKILKVMDRDVHKYAAPLIELFIIFFKQLNKEYTFEGLKNVFECVGTFIILVGNNQEASKLIYSKLLDEINSLVSKGVNEISCYALQIYAVMIRYLPGFPVDVTNILLNTLLSEKFTGNDAIGLFPAYAVLFDQMISSKPELLVTHSDALKQLGAKMVNNRIDHSFFQITAAVIDVLGLDDLKASGWLTFQINSCISVISLLNPQQADPNKTFRPLYFKEYVMQLMRFDYFKEAESVHKGATEIILSFPSIHMFIQFFKKRPEVTLICFGLTKLVTEEFEIFQQLGIMGVWQGLFTSLLKNFNTRTMMLRASVRQNLNAFTRANDLHTSSEVLQNQAIKDVKEIGDVSGFTRLSSLPPRQDEILEQAKQAGQQNDVNFCLNKIRDFLRGPGSNLNYDFLDNDLKTIIEGIQPN